MTQTKTPFDTLRATVLEAVEAYDGTNDHTPHGAGADCVRCRLVAAFRDEAVEPFLNSTAQLNQRRVAHGLHPLTKAFRT